MIGLLHELDCLIEGVPVMTTVRFEVIKILTYLLTTWSRVLLEKLTGFAANQEIPRAFYGTIRKFITVLTSARHLSLSWANSIQSPQPLPTSCRSILILSSHLVYIYIYTYYTLSRILYIYTQLILNQILLSPSFTALTIVHCFSPMFDR